MQTLVLLGWKPELLELLKLTMRWKNSRFFFHRYTNSETSNSTAPTEVYLTADFTTEKNPPAVPAGVGPDGMIAVPVLLVFVFVVTALIIA